MNRTAKQIKDYDALYCSADGRKEKTEASACTPYQATSNSLHPTPFTPTGNTIPDPSVVRWEERSVHLYL